MLSFLSLSFLISRSELPKTVLSELLSSLSSPLSCFGIDACAKALVQVVDCIMVLAMAVAVVRRCNGVKSPTPYLLAIVVPLLSENDLEY
jgi:hypothetical protein